MRWGVEKRLEFIDFRLYWEGGINRADIIDYFGVSVPQASKDLALYAEKAPGNLFYDKSAKRYFASNGFQPAFFTPDVNGYLAQIVPQLGHVEPASESWISVGPETESLPIPHRHIGTEVFKSILNAIRMGRSLDVLYQSMNPKRGEPEWRKITPHAMASDGLRWHARAFCHIDSKFKDFILSRCTDAGETAEPGAIPSDDRFWNEDFTIHLVPNPALSKSQQAVIALDYEMSDGVAAVSVRKALLYYFQKRLRLDVAGAADRPQETPVIVSNKDAFDAALTEAMS